MGLLDDAIREHLELKLRHGADPAEVERLEREALGPVEQRGEYAPAPVDITPHTAFAEEPEEGDAGPGSLSGAYAYEDDATRVHQAAVPAGEDEYEDEDYDYYEDEEEGYAEPAGADSLEPPHPAGATGQGPAAPVYEPGEEEWEYEDEDEGEPASEAPDSARQDEPPPGARAAGSAFGGAAAAESYEDEPLTEIFGEPADRHASPPQADQPTEGFPAAAREADEPGREELWGRERENEGEDAGQQTAAYSADEVAEASGRGGEAPPPAEEDVLEETPEFLQETPEHDRLWFEQRPPRRFDFDQ